MSACCGGLISACVAPHPQSVAQTLLTRVAYCDTFPIEIVGKACYMFVSNKCQYALRAVLELAKNYGYGPIKIAEIARSAL